MSGGWTIQKVYDLPMYDQLPGVPRRRALLEALQRARRLRVLLLGNQSWARSRLVDGYLYLWRFLVHGP